MFSAPGSTLLPAGERQLFSDEFEKDLKFVQVFMLLFNRSCPIKNVDLVWVEAGPGGRAGWRHMGIVQALSGPCSRLLHCTTDNPHPAFCNLINDFGMHEAESCSVSDKRAEERVSRSRKAEVYRCNFGLTDIAVPVIADGHHIATLFSGQVLREPPSRAGFRQIRKDVAHLAHVSVRDLKAAYWNAPVVSEDDIGNTVTLLEVFAEFLASSWQRLFKAVGEERHKSRELEVLRKEFAYILLEGSAAGHPDLRPIMRRIGFGTYPNRVMVVRFESGEQINAPGVSPEGALTAALHAIEELCERLDNIAPVYLRGRGVCIFFREPEGRSGSSGKLAAQDLAQAILHAIVNRTAIRARIGIGGVREDFRALAESYHEANIALADSTNAIAFSKTPAPSVPELSAFAEQIGDCFANRKLDDARLIVNSLPLHADRYFGRDLAAQKRFFSSALAAMCFAARKLGCEETVMADLRVEANRAVECAEGTFELQQAYLQLAESILDHARQLYSGKTNRIVDRACHVIDRRLEQNDPAQPVSLRALASALGISASHLSRMFRQTTGRTFQRHVIVRRIETARRLLLDPGKNVTQVAEQCGFSDSSYFARVFRKVVGCSPARYSKDPSGAGPAAG